MGDDFVTYGWPFADVSSGGSIHGLIAAIDKRVIELPADMKMIPGHGKVSTGQGHEEASAKLKDCVELIEAQVKKKKTLDQVKEQAPRQVRGDGQRVHLLGCLRDDDLQRAHHGSQQEAGGGGSGDGKGRSSEEEVAAAQGRSPQRDCPDTTVFPSCSGELVAARSRSARGREPAPSTSPGPEPARTQEPSAVSPKRPAGAARRRVLFGRAPPG